MGLGNMVGDNSVIISYNGGSKELAKELKCESWKYMERSRSVRLTTMIGSKEFTTIVPLDNIISITLPAGREVDA